MRPLCSMGPAVMRLEEQEFGNFGFVYRFRGPGEALAATSEPVCICRPSYGWDRIDTTVDEGPFAVERGDDLFVTFRGLQRQRAVLCRPASR